MKTWADFRIELPPNPSGNVRTTCPECSNQRKKRGVKCLAVDVEKGCWHCHHCGWSGGLGKGAERPRDLHWQKPAYRMPEPRPEAPLPEQAMAWFRKRRITDEIVRRNRIGYGEVYMPQLEDYVTALSFPYYRDGELVNRKYRDHAKNFRMEVGAERILYGLDDVQEDRLIWVEGELDKLALEVAGFTSVVSVPDGAPTPAAKDYSKKFEFLETAKEKLDRVAVHVLAVDSDEPGRALEDELARRIGREKCLRVSWPEGCKDANDVLVKFGAIELEACIKRAEPFPIKGVFEVLDKAENLYRLYESGFERGYRTGWNSLDSLYTVRPGEFTVVTGIPGSGKSNWIDCLLVNLARTHGWRFAVFSPENLPIEHHMAMVAEKYSGRPFHDGPTQRMSKPELADAMAWVADHFLWILPNDEDDWQIENILGIAGQLCFRKGIRGLVIDPWNELESLRPPGMTETDYISRVLKRTRVFARTRGIHVWMVVHPAKLSRQENGKYPVPTLYDCSGSAHWRNKADNGICVWRDLSGDDRAEVDIQVQKIRFRQIGKRGCATLLYEGACATYRDAGGDFPEDRERYA